MPRHLTLYYSCSFAILYRIGCVTTHQWCHGSLNSINGRVPIPAIFWEAIAVDTFSNLIWDVWHGIISWPVYCPLLAELRASGPGWALAADRHTLTTSGRLTGATTVKHFSRFSVFLGCPLYTQRWHLWEATIRQAVRLIPEGEVIAVAFDDTTKKKAGRHIEGRGRYRNSAGSARQSISHTAGFKLCVGPHAPSPHALARHGLSVPIGLELYRNPTKPPPSPCRIDLVVS